MPRSCAASTKLRPCSVTSLTASVLNSAVNVLRVVGMADSWVRAYAPNLAPAIGGEVHPRGAQHGCCPARRRWPAAGGPRRRRRMAHRLGEQGPARAQRLPSYFHMPRLGTDNIKRLLFAPDRS